jgi:hypothetical protein
MNSKVLRCKPPTLRKTPDDPTIIPLKEKKVKPKVRQFKCTENPIDILKSAEQRLKEKYWYKGISKQQIIDLAAEGKTVPEIAKELKCIPEDIHAHIRSLGFNNVNSFYQFVNFVNNYDLHLRALQYRIYSNCSDEIIQNQKQHSLIVDTAILHDKLAKTGSGSHPTLSLQIVLGHSNPLEKVQVVDISQINTDIPDKPTISITCDKQDGHE